VSRISKEEMYLRMAEVAASRAACNRCSVGAVITDAALRNVLSVGYNGPPAHQPNKCPGDPNTAGACGCVHAEVNALMKARFDSTALTIFVTVSPCINCARLILNSNIRAVYYRAEYRNNAGAQLLISAGVSCYVLSAETVLDYAQERRD